jgi:hypothetical protein
MWAFGRFAAEPGVGAEKSEKALHFQQASEDAVAARLAPAALGTDTGGSIRVPAALCGITSISRHRSALAYP